MNSKFSELDNVFKVVGEKRLTFLGVAMTVMALGVVLAYTLPTRYEAQSTVFLEQNVITDLVKGIAVTPPVEAKIRMLSVALLSRTMLLKVLSDLNRDLVLKSDRDVEAYLKDLSKRIDIVYLEKKGVFKIAIRDGDPIFARDFVNTLTRKYIDENTSSKRVESLEANKFLAQQIESFKKRIDDAEDAVNKFKSENGLLLVTDEVYLRGEIAAAEKKLEELVIKRNTIEAKREIFLERGTDGESLSGAEARLAELRSRYTDENPKVIKAKAALASMSRKRRDGSRELSPAQRDSLKMLQVELDAMKEMEERQKEIIEDSKKRLRDIPNLRAELAELVRKKDNEAVVYQQLVTRYGQSEVAKQMELQDKSVSFRVLDPAVTPVVPVSPNRLLIILGSVFAGFGLGLAVVMLLDILKGAVKSPNALKELDIPVFAIVPHVPDAKIDAQNRRKDRLILGFAAGYLLVVLAFATADILHLGEISSETGSFIKNKITRIVRN